MSFSNKISDENDYDDESFLLTLPSNVFSYLSFNNTVSQYITKLNERIELNGNWKVCCPEVSYTISFFNVFENQPIYLQIYRNGSPYLFHNDAFLPAARYDYIQDLINVLNNEIKKKFKDLVPNETKSGNFLPKVALYDNHSRHIQIKNGVLNNCVIFLKLTNELYQMLGFPSNQIKQLIIKMGETHLILGQKESQQNFTQHERPSKDDPIWMFKSDLPYDIRAGLYNIFLYSDIVAPSKVGDTTARLLRIIPIPSNVSYGLQLHQTFSILFWHRLITNTFETISISFRDAYNNPIQFLYGRSYCVLMFEKMQISLKRMYLPTDETKYAIEKTKKKSKKTM